MLLSKCAKCGSKKSRFTKNQEAKGPFVDHLQKTKKEFKNFKKQDIQTIFTKMNLKRLAFNMIWLMETLNIWQK